ncbi:phosphonate metabolism protein/1,5-bisphosphokinase (PRPP-forming) PhnN [Anianabacter salinae]|uniref:phosphonate metabolism protein/1,5-bisphosphokinase (PRPP-forming) PhnN n=1 Tax=Anianabacter salinae TaxID=2851023 RepID=UPI00225E519C|nr:phosphonate metabolism protein/1,5-bisphosphokinase (PRPP-forming) PhnN [Anianabacter salinae]MBV0911219.1 phosphonate metabolism protein/1,5-bisphosphokinase (PRPP-forming) PhnN [Anianabacter salinae]
MSGRLIAVVGPSGVGKDSLIDALAARRPALHKVRRVITRPPEAGGEDHEPETEAGFAARRAAGAFCLSWGAHGLFYGIPAAVQARVAAGGDAIVNLSRGVLEEAGRAFDRLVVLNVTATPETLARRLAGRGREDEAGIARRLARRVDLPGHLDVRDIPNDGALADAVEMALAKLYPVRA